MMNEDYARELALKLAVGTPGVEPASQTVDRAEKYLEFLMKKNGETQ